MSILLTLLLAIIIPILLLKLFEYLHHRWHWCMYWAITPISLTIGLVGPFLIQYSSGMEVSIAIILDYSVKTGYLAYFVIPGLISAVISTLVGYAKDWLE